MDYQLYKLFFNNETRKKLLTSFLQNKKSYSYRINSEKLLTLEGKDVFEFPFTKRQISKLENRKKKKQGCVIIFTVCQMNNFRQHYSTIFSEFCKDSYSDISNIMEKKLGDDEEEEEIEKEFNELDEVVENDKYEFIMKYKLIEKLMKIKDDVSEVINILQE